MDEIKVGTKWKHWRGEECLVTNLVRDLFDPYKLFIIYLSRGKLEVCPFDDWFLEHKTLTNKAVKRFTLIED